jgi:hypothetical protein
MSITFRQEIDAVLQRLELDSNPLAGARVRAFAYANDLENRVGKIRDALRKALLPMITEQGKSSDKGVLLEGDGATVVLTQRRNAPSLEAVQTLCEKKGLKVEQATDSVTTVKVSVSKLEALVERGVLTQADLDGISGHTPVLTGKITE